MRQVERERLVLDRAANDYLEPEYWIRDSSAEPVGAVLRQLLSHSSGLPLPDARQFETKPDGRARTLSEYLAEGLQTIWTPGEKLIYSNEGFALLGYLAAQAENEDFESHAQRVLFGPLGMTDSSFTILDDMRPNLAELYGSDASHIERMDMSAVGPAGSLHTTASDLARFALLHLGGGTMEGVRVLSEESVHEMMRLQSTQHPSLPDGFGLGFGVLGEAGRRMVWWDGFVPGATSRLALLPDDGVGVVILTNSQNPLPVQAISQRIFDLLVGPVTLPAEPSEDVINEAIGEYRLIDIMDPAQWYLNLLPIISVEVHDGLLRLGSPFLDGSVTLQPLGSGRYRISGALYEGATVLYEDDHLYVHMLEVQRVSAWGNSTALLTYLALFSALALSLVGIGTHRVIRHLRT
jgi:CubicO group peptidase (beta-lactamase class C family)